MEKARKRVNLAVQNIVLGVGGYVIKHNNIRARNINLFRNDGTHLSDIGINVYLNTIQQGALESFLSSSGPRVLPLQYQNLDVFSLSISEVFVGGLLAVSGFRPTHLAGSDKTTVGHNPTIGILSCGTTSR
jgi:hypothetical protein